MASNLPKTYKAAVYEKAGASLTIKELPLKEPDAGQVLVKVVASGVCYSDVHVGEGSFGSPFPLVPGHEIVGDVVALGSGVEEWKVGDRVGGAWHGGHDGTCRQCKRGQFVMCQNQAINGVNRDGGYAEYVLLRTEAVIPIPKELDPAETAPLLCAGVTVFNSLRNQKKFPGSICAVSGLGGLGHLGIQYASKMGFKVAAISSSGSKEKFAKDLGADIYIDTSKQDPVEELTKLGGASVILATVSNPEVTSKLPAGLEPGGNLLAIAPTEMNVHTGVLIMGRRSIVGFPSGDALDTEEAIDFAQLKDIKCMVEKFPLKDVSEALEKMKSGKVRFRSVLVM